MWKIEFSKIAEKQFEKLPLNIQCRVLNSLERIKLRPHKFVKTLIGTKYFRLRIEDYRVILDLQNKKLIIMIIEIGHRKNIYK